MKKLIFISLNVILICIFILAISFGIKLFNVPSIGKISLLNKELDLAKEKAAYTSSVKYDETISLLKATKEKLEKAKSEYENAIALSSTEEFASLGQLEKYNLEYIWVKLGVYAKKNKLESKFVPVAVSNSENNSLYDIDFTILGNYISIIDFIYAIESDDDLMFVVEDLNMIPVTKDGNTFVQAQFKTRGITILK